MYIRQFTSSQAKPSYIPMIDTLAQVELNWVILYTDSLGRVELNRHPEIFGNYFGTDALFIPSVEATTSLPLQNN